MPTKRKAIKSTAKRKTTSRPRKAKSLIPVSKATNAYKLLDEVKALILAEPLRYNQENWLVEKSEYIHNLPYDARKGFPACGTVACVAGWVTRLKDPTIKNSAISERAADILGLDTHQADTLFNGGALTVAADPQTPEYANAGVAHIQDFQDTYEEQLKAKVV